MLFSVSFTTEEFQNEHCFRCGKKGVEEMGVITLNSSLSESIPPGVEKIICFGICKECLLSRQFSREENVQLVEKLLQTDQAITDLRENAVEAFVQ